MRNLNIHITNGCNFDCPVCFENRDLENPNFLDKEKLMSFIKDFSPPHVGFMGGEPLMHPDLPSIIQELRSLNIHTCIVTNGELLNTVDVYPDKFSIGIDNDNQIEVDKWLSDNENNINDDIFGIEITITPTDITKIDSLIDKYLDLNCGVNISLLAFWNKKPIVKELIKDEYINKILELSDRNDITLFGERWPDQIHAFYKEYIPYNKEFYCCEPISVFSDGHIDYCGLETLPTSMTLDNYDIETLVKPDFVMYEQCKFCNSRRTR